MHVAQMGDVNHEPTMEEILASIKKIIAEDGDAGDGPHALGTRSREPESVEEEPADDTVLELTESVAEVPDTPEIEHSVPVPEDASAAGDTLASDDTVSASNAAFAALSSIADGSAGDLREASPALEGMVREMLRPMLREWIDTNLPDMVEKLVAQEIARIVAERN